MGLKYNNPLEGEPRTLSKFGKLVLVTGGALLAVIAIICVVNAVHAGKTKAIVAEYRIVCNSAVNTCKVVAGNDKGQADIIKGYQKKLDKAQTTDALNTLTTELIAEVTAYVQSIEVGNEQYLLDELIGAMNEVNYVYSEVSKRK